MSIGIGPTIYSYWYNPAFNTGRILESTNLTGMSIEDIRKSKLYAGGRADIKVNNVDDELLPRQGINWITELSVLKNLNENAEPLTKLYSTMDIYALLSGPDKLFLSLHLGGGHIFSNSFEYFQAFTLGGNNYLRGYRMNRFSGSSVAYGSCELKVKLFDFNAYLIKADAGLVGFTDVGRVWMKGEQSQKWHIGYGGGVYLTPFRTMMLSLVVGLSEEEQLLNASLGSRINMVFQGR
jgi:outer membrane translocation and assembly module TamA